MTAPTAAAGPVTGLRNQAVEGEDKDCLDGQHQTYEQPLPPGGEDNASGQHQDSSQRKRVNGEPDGDARASDAGPEPEAQGFTAGMPGNPVGHGRPQFVELFPRVLVLSRHSPIVPNFRIRRVVERRAAAGEAKQRPLQQNAEEAAAGYRVPPALPAVT